MKKYQTPGLRWLTGTWLFFLLAATALAQPETATVEVKGIGIKREDALQDGLRAAVGKAAGTTISSETRVENFMVIQDAISTRIEGYIAGYEVIQETPFPDRYEMMLRAKVSLSPLKADLNLLTQSLGGVRFLVMYDHRHIPEAERPVYDYAVERVNEYLAGKKYRYIERKRFESLREEALKIMYEDPSQATFVQKLGLLSDAQFIIQIDRISTANKLEAFDTRQVSKVTVEAKAFDNCTAEGLGTVALESDWKSGQDAGASARNGVAEAVAKGSERLLGTFTSYIGDWVNNGTPYELRFYGTGSFRDFRDMRAKLKADPNFGGQMEVVAVQDYTRLNCTFRRKPDELADKVLDYADEVPAFKDRRMDVKLFYGRQLSFAPQNVPVPEVQERTAVGLPATPQPVPAAPAQPAAAKASAPASGSVKKPAASKISKGKTLQKKSTKKSAARK